MNTNYYIYGHYTADTDELFYIGKGTKKRAWSTKRTRKWKNKVKKHGLVVKLLHEHLTEEDALAKEVELIAEARSHGINLVNVLPGGDGFTSESARQAWQDPVISQKIIESLKEANADEGLRKRRSEIQKERMRDKSLRQQISQKMKGNTNGIGITTSEGRMNMKVVRTEQWQDKTYRDKNLQSRKQYMENGGTGPNAGRTRNPFTGEFFLPNVPYPYTLQSPDGVPYTFTSLREFSTTHKIPRQQLARLLTGKRKDYMGWVIII